jgi:hypothetical protein
VSSRFYSLLPLWPSLVTLTVVASVLMVEPLVGHRSRRNGLACRRGGAEHDDREGTEEEAEAVAVAGTRCGV